jgi:hypothetical protein
VCPENRNHGERKRLGDLHRERRNGDLFAVVSGEPSPGRNGLAGDYIAQERSAATVDNGNMKWARGGIQLKGSLAVATESIRKLASKPVQPDAVTAGPIDAIHHNPEVVFAEEHGSTVDAAKLALVAVVLTLAEYPLSVVFEAQELGLGPIQALEFSEVKHLVTTVHLDSVVTSGAEEMVVPFLRSVVQITSRIDKNVVVPPPNVQVKHINLGKTVHHCAAAKRRERV